MLESQLLRANVRVERKGNEIVRIAMAFTDDANFCTNRQDAVRKMQK